MSADVKATTRPSREMTGSELSSAAGEPSGRAEMSFTARNGSSSLRSQAKTGASPGRRRRCPLPQPGTASADAASERNATKRPSPDTAGWSSPRWTNVVFGLVIGAPATSCDRSTSSIGTVTSTTLIVVSPALSMMWSAGCVYAMIAPLRLIGGSIDDRHVVAGQRRSVGSRRDEFPTSEIAAAQRQPGSVDVPTLTGVVVAEHVERQLGDDHDAAPVARDDGMDAVAGANAVRNRW